MQAIILAAGAGRRLGQKIPKPLIEIGGRPLVVRLIEQFRREGIEEIVMVTGYRRHQVEEVTQPYRVNSIFNPFYPTSDNLVSFWMGQKHISENCIMSHGDLIFEADVLKRLLETEGDIVLPIDQSSVDPEGMKILMRGGRLMDLSKTIPADEATGESIPLMRFSSRALGELKALTERVLESGQFGQYIDDSVLDLIQIGEFRTTVLDVTGLRWVEIDTPEDLAEAKRLFR